MHPPHLSLLCVPLRSCENLSRSKLPWLPGRKCPQESIHTSFLRTFMTLWLLLLKRSLQSRARPGCRPCSRERVPQLMTQATELHPGPQGQHQGLCLSASPQHSTSLSSEYKKITILSFLSFPSIFLVFDTRSPITPGWSQMFTCSTAAF